MIYNNNKIVSIEEITTLTEATNDMQDIPSEQELEILFDISAIFLQRIFYGKLFDKNTGDLNSDIGNGVDFKTIKLIFATMIMKQKNEFTYFDFFSYNFKNDVTGAETEVESYEPETIFEALGLTVRTMIENLAIYKAVINNNSDLLVEDSPSIFVTKSELLEQGVSIVGNLTSL